LSTVAPSFTVISNVLPFFFVMFSLFNGVVRPYSQLSVFWRYWFYYLNPSTYWIGGVLAATLNNTPGYCSSSELAIFNPPPGMDCGTYAANFLNSAPGNVGNLTNPLATSNCGYCQYRSGVDYIATLNISPKDKWGYFGIFLGFCCSNWALVYFFIYTVRIRGWTFGFGYIFGAVGKLIGAVKGLFKGKGKKEVEDA
jgi:ATP-binding cassette subfamily G (WHITE) protein 2 (SNQ2)